MDMNNYGGYNNGELRIGDEGPGVGWLFYYDPFGFAVNGRKCHYLECSKDVIGITAWCTCKNPYCKIPTKDNIGAGYTNTQKILGTKHFVKKVKLSAENCAAKACAEYKTATTEAGEWFLPSKDELDKMYENLDTEKISNTSWYWSSSQNVYGYALSQGFGNGECEYTFKNIVYCVRAVRAF